MATMWSNSPLGGGEDTLKTGRRSPDWERPNMSGSNSATPRLNLVLHGRRGAGKTSAGNTILGLKESDLMSEGDSVDPSPSAVCQETVCGYLVTVVEMPALFNTQLSEALRNTRKCVSLCEPGVHAFLLVIPEGPLTDEDKGEMRRMQEIYGSGVTDYMMVLHTTELRNTSVGSPQVNDDVQQIVQMCGGRHHVFNSTLPHGNPQVEKLLKKIQVMVTEKKDNCYTPGMFWDAQVETLLKFDSQLEDMKKLLSLAQQSTSSGLQEEDDCLRIVLLGKTGVGKSTTGNTILGRDVFDVSFSDASVTTACQKVTATVHGRKITVVDTPGLFDTDTDNDEITKEIIKCISMAAPGPHVFLLVLQLGQRFTQEERDTVKMIQDIFGEKARMYTVVLFTKGDQLDGKRIEEYVEKCSDKLKKVIQSCENRFHAFNNKDKQNGSQVTKLLEKIDTMVAVNGGSCYTNKTFQEVEKTLRAEQARILEQREEEMQREMEELKNDYEEKIEEIGRQMEQKWEEQEKERERRENEFSEREEQVKKWIVEWEKREKEEHIKREEEYRRRKEDDERQREKWEREKEAERKKQQEEWETKMWNYQIQREKETKDREEKQRNERQSWEEKQKREREEFEKEKQKMEIERQQEDKKRKDEEEKMRRDWEEKIRNAEESKRKELEALQKEEWEKRKKEHEERMLEDKRRKLEEERKEQEWQHRQRKEQENYENKMKEEKQNQEMEGKKWKEELEKEKKRREKETEEILQKKDKEIKQQQEQWMRQKEKEERERREKEEEQRREMEKSLKKQREEYERERETENQKRKEAEERYLNNLREKHKEEKEELRKQSEENARKEAEEEFCAKLDEKVRLAKTEGHEEGRVEGIKEVEDQRTAPGRLVDSIWNYFSSKKTSRKKD